MFRPQTKLPDEMLSGILIAVCKKYGFLGLLAVQQFLRQYRFIELTDEKLTQERAFLIGNDPVISGLAEFKSKERIALVATSGVRALSIALQLNDETSIPQIFLIDNSLYVHQIWKNLKQLFIDSSSEREFLEKFDDFFELNKDSLHREEYQIGNYARLYKYKKAQYEESAHRFFSKIFDNYSYGRVKEVVKNIILIRQSFEDPRIFSTIKFRCEWMKIKSIYVYSSNIIPYVKEYEGASQIARNILSLKPTLSIHSNMCAYHAFPEKIFFFSRAQLCSSDAMLSMSNQCALFRVQPGLLPLN